MGTDGGCGVTKRRCTATTKSGAPCKAAPLKDQDVCMAHTDEETRRSVNFGGPSAGALGGRPANPKPSEVARRLIEQNELVLQRPYWRTLGYDVKLGPDGPYLVEMDEGGAKLYGESKEGDICVSGHDDLGAMMTAAEKLQDRVYGRPKVSTEISGPEGQPIKVDLPTEQAWHAEVAKVLEASGALGADPDPG